MQHLILTAITMVAFAANSVLNRLALAGGDMDAVTFGVIRVVAGAVVLLFLARALRGAVTLGGSGRLVGVLSLVAYIFGFSMAYRSLDAGLGALILFGVVQITMFAGALIAREPTPARRWIGSALAFGGLIWLLAPSSGAPSDPVAVAAMVIAGLGWGLYSLVGRGSADPLMATAANFTLAAPIAGAVLLTQMPLHAPSPFGIWMAVLSGAVTSGLGYALWYAVLPRLQTAVAAVAQLTVPAIAMAGGILFLGEDLTTRFLLGSVLIIGGVLVSVLSPRRTTG